MNIKAIFNYNTQMQALMGINKPMTALNNAVKTILEPQIFDHVPRMYYPPFICVIITSIIALFFQISNPVF